MFESPILDLAIALSFTYFILGLIVSTAHEFFFSVLTVKQPKRARYLKQSIESLFFDDDWQGFVQEKIFKNVHIAALKKSNHPDVFPSYIPNANFALAVLDQFRDGSNTLTLARIKEILTSDELSNNAAIPASLRAMLLGMVERADNDLNKLQQNIEDYFNSAMNRLGGDYVRSTKKYIFIIAVVLSCALNADTIQIAKTLWQSPDALKQTANNIQAAVNEVKKDSSGTYSISSPDENTVVFYTKLHTGDSAGHDPSDTSKVVNFPKYEISRSVMTLKNTGIPIGWSKDNLPKGDSGLDIFLSWLIKLFGLLLTSFALLLGAPFWFDLLNKIVNIRGSGKKEGDGSSAAQQQVQPVKVIVNQPGEEAVG